MDLLSCAQRTFTIILLQARTRGRPAIQAYKRNSAITFAKMHGSFCVRRLVVQSRNPFASPHLDYKPLSNSDDIQVPKFDSMGSMTRLSCIL